MYPRRVYNNECGPDSTNSTCCATFFLLKSRWRFLLLPPPILHYCRQISLACISRVSSTGPRSGFACHSDQVRKDSGFEFIHLFDYHHPTTRSEGNRRNVRSLIYFSLAETRRLTTTCMKRRKREMNSFLLGVSWNHIPNWSSGHSVRFVDTPRRQTNQLWLTNVFKYSETDATWSSMWTTCWQHDRCLIVLLLLCQGW